VLKVEVLPVVLEVRALHTVLQTMADEPNDTEVAVRALELLQQDTGVSVAFFRHDPPRGKLCCEIARGFAESEPAGAELCVEGFDLVAQAFARGAAIEVEAERPGDPKLPLFEGPFSSAVAEPVFSGGKTVGVVVVVARSGALKPSTRRLLDGICAALAAMAHQRALKTQATQARKVAADRDRLATIGQLVAGVAHEINNPLAFLKSNLHSLKAEVHALGPSAAATLTEVEEIVSESLEGVARIEAIVQALKNTARQRNEAQRFDPARAVAEAITIFRGAKKGEAELSIELAPDIPEVMGVASHLGQVALNLLQNGLDAMGGRGRLLVRGSQADGGARFEFIDRGAGIPAEVQAKMFDAFFTTKEPGKGTGLGLFLCKEIVERLKGRLEYRTGPNGTTFEVWVPSCPAT
jgi:signal transduction histidine kinase